MLSEATSLLRRPSPPGRRDELIRLVTRLVVAQAAAGAAIGLMFSRRQLSSILITLVFAVAVCGLAVLVRTGTHPAWLLAITFEAAFFVYGLSAFMFARYVGGTLFSVITLGTLLHPAVARSFAAVPAAERDAATGEFGARESLGEPAGELGGQALG